MSDLLLSSGFLAFARHAGVISAIEARGIAIEAICGTSSGAVVGALWAAGHPPREIMRVLAERPPRASLVLSRAPWRGLFRLDRLVEALAARLPARFEELPRPLAVGVVDLRGVHRLVSSGPLPEAVAASCAMPYVFEPVEVGGERLRDGGAADRLAVGPWRAWRPGRAAIASHVAKTRGVDLPADLEGVTVVKTPRSGASFGSLGDWEAQLGEAEALAHEAMRGAFGT